MLKSIVFTIVIFLQVSCGYLTEYDDCTTPDGRMGQCKPIVHCSPVKEALKTLKKSQRPHFWRTLRESNCGYIGKTPKVCCSIEVPKTGIDASSDLIDVITNESSYPPPNITNHQNLNLLPTECGKHQSGDVENDDLMNNGYPWTVLIIYVFGNKTLVQCGGSIINERYILTSAHCVRNKWYQLKAIRLGNFDSMDTDIKVSCTPNRKNNFDCNLQPSEENILVEEIKIHPKYNGRTLKNDVALLRLCHPIDFSTGYKYPICLPITKALREINIDKQTAIMSGWGKDYLNLLTNGTDSEKRQFCDITVRRYMPVAILQTSESNQNLKQDYQYDESTNDPIYVQYGLVSLNKKKCGKNKNIGVYYNLSYYLGWILSMIRP